MNQPNKQKRLAEALGWTELVNNPLRGLNPRTGKRENVPNYFNDLNAAHELGEAMKERGLRKEWIWELGEIVELSDSGYAFCWAQATAAQRSDAALAVLEAREKEER